MITRLIKLIIDNIELKLMINKMNKMNHKINRMENKLSCMKKCYKEYLLMSMKSCTKMQLNSFYGRFGNNDN